MNAAEAMDMNARTRPGKMSKPEMKSMEWKPAENGGHVFMHRIESENGGYHEPAMHTFGKDEGKKALEHFAKHSGLTEHMGDELPEGDEDSAAGAAT